ncbi:exopolysaccharide biosynthesis protein [Roseisalinus antarcticus]|uniref:Exopolysaccharide synthesis, ExoD n=1 Tax=Roseisalinus antarcticus TaxID=254357 RepID=A0A1Y5RP74_9RHOB|nr:exopolysaccharide biosynthesis protein [Roseisalinus antarcticus]SLN22247.1 Exopolysaccharide synthesis, ExoD [Roseisalinus antarcticus]
MKPASTCAGHPVGDIVDRLDALSAEPVLSLRMLLRVFGTASFVPALMIPAILVVSPLSGIPFFSSICGLTIALVALQMLFRRTHLWLPAVLMERQVTGRQLSRAMGGIRRLAGWIDAHTSPRLAILADPPGIAVPQALAVLSGSAMPFLELMPFSSSILGLAVLLYSVSFLARDGLYVIAGAATTGVALGVPLFVWSRIFG